jgi:hypothetical protein
VHRQRLYKAADIVAGLLQVGFRVRTTRSYGDFRLPTKHCAFIAQRPPGAGG